MLVFQKTPVIQAWSKHNIFIVEDDEEMEVYLQTRLRQQMMMWLSEEAVDRCHQAYMNACIKKIKLTLAKKR